MTVSLKTRRKRDRHGGARLPAVVTAALRAPGEPLAVPVRRELEQRLGHDFADVRVHADASAATAARALDAHAFTSGADIVFAPGRYRPDRADGLRLLAHELVHTLQQGRAEPALQVASPVIETTDPLEREAAAVADRVAQGESVPRGAVAIAAPAARGRIARQAVEAVAPLEVPDSPDAVSDIADDVARLLAFDPQDAFGRVRRRLIRLAPATREAVAEAARGRVPAPAAARLTEVLAALQPPGAAPRGELHMAEPEPVPEQPAETAETSEEPPARAEETAPEREKDDAEVPEPEAEPEAPVAVPKLAGEVEAETPAKPARAARERAEAPAADGTDRLAEPGEHAPPEEDTADAGPVEDADNAPEQEDAEDVAPAPEDEAATQVPEPPDAASGEGADEAPLQEAPEESGDPDEPAADAEAPVGELPDAEPEPAEQETVLEKPPEETAEGEEPAPADTLAGGEPAAPLESEVPEAGEGGEPDEAPDTARDEAEADAGAQPVAGADEGVGVEIPEPADPGAPDVSGADPADAMATVGKLPPAHAQAALSGVDAAATRSVGVGRAALAEQPPELERPTGAPSAGELAAEAAGDGPPAAAAPARLMRAAAPAAVQPSRLAPLPPAPPLTTADARAPQVHGGSEGELSAGDRDALHASIAALPVRDPGLDVPVGAAPALVLEGPADPQRARAERAKAEDAAGAALTDGRVQILRPAGEERLVPRVPPERLRAAVPRVAAPPQAAAAPAPVEDDAQPTSILAREQRGTQLRAAATAASASMRASQAEQAATAAAERQRSQDGVAQLVQENAAAQADQRRRGRTEVHDQRRSWSAAEHAHSERALTDADQRVRTDLDTVARAKADADTRAAKHIETGARDADRARRAGEAKAAEERKRGERETSGPIGWLAKKAGAFFDEIKRGITAAFEAARVAVRDAIEGAKRLAVEAIDTARAAIVETIGKAGEAVIAFGDKMLAGFPALRDGFRTAIRTAVAATQAAIDRLADDLKRGVQKALDLLGSALDAALGLLEKGLLVAVDGYRAAVMEALSFSNRVIKGFAAFAVLIKHIAANPKQWLRKLAAAAKDGVRKHLWKAFKKAIKEWFWGKVEEVLGLGLTIWNVLKSGGISLAHIGSMAWEGIKAAIPPALIQILIEKLISLLIPAAAAVMLIIETLQAAWGTVQRVLEAFERFFVFLKAVRTGKAGPHFANVIAAAAVAVIDFVANWLLKRLRKPAGKIAKKLKALAKKLGKKLKKLGKRLFKRGKKRKPKKPKKGKKPDKTGTAEKRVRAATDFISQKLDRGIWQPVLYVQMKYARVRWNVRIAFHESGEHATLDISGSGGKKAKAKKQSKPWPKYNDDVGKYQGFLREYHHRHHLLGQALRTWWNAIGLAYNDPKYFIEIPEMLHLRGLHRTLTKLEAAKARKLSGAFKRKLRDDWNAEWQKWLTVRARKWGTANLGAIKAAFTANPSLRTQVQKDVEGVGIPKLLSLFTLRVGVDLQKFRVRTYHAQIHAKYMRQLDRLVKMVAKAVATAPPKATAAEKDKLKRQAVDDWQLWLLGIPLRKSKRKKSQGKWVRDR